MTKSIDVIGGIAILFIAIYLMTKLPQEGRYTAFSTVAPNYIETNNTLIIPKKDFFSDLITRSTINSKGCAIKYDLDTDFVINCPEGMEIAGSTRDKTLHITDSIANDQMGVTTIYNKYKYTGRRVRIAVLDTGVDTDHPELVTSLVGGKAFGYSGIEDKHGHGTHVTGIIAADGIKPSAKGVAPDAEIWTARVCGDFGECPMSNVGAAIEYIVNNHVADIISISNGYPATTESDCNNEWIAKKANWAVSKGVIIVAAAGNDPAIVYAPSCASSIISVANVDFSDNRASNSATGDSVDVSAPGTNIYSTYLNGDYAAKSGTSMAAPQVSGVLALLKEKNPSLSPAQYRFILITTARDLDPSGWDRQYGFGRVNALGALIALDSPLATTTTTTATIRTTTSSSTTATTIFRGQCTNECISTFEIQCRPEGSIYYVKCGQYDMDSCLDWSDLTTSCPQNTVCRQSECQRLFVPTTISTPSPTTFIPTTLVPQITTTTQSSGIITQPTENFFAGIITIVALIGIVTLIIK